MQLLYIVTLHVVLQQLTQVEVILVSDHKRWHAF